MNRRKNQRANEIRSDWAHDLKMRLAEMMAPPLKKKEMEAQGYRHSNDIFKSICKKYHEFEEEWSKPEKRGDWIQFCESAKIYKKKRFGAEKSSFFGIDIEDDKPWRYRFWSRNSDEELYNIYCKWEKLFNSDHYAPRKEKRVIQTDEKKTKFKLSKGVKGSAWIQKKKKADHIDGRGKNGGCSKDNPLRGTKK